MPCLIFIEGIIGVGKSTLLGNIGKRLNNVETFQEPVSKFTLLSKFYQDQQKFAFPFQKQVLNEIKTLMDTIYDKFSDSQKTIVVERSPISCAIFTHQLFQNDKLSKDQRKVIFDEVKKNFEKMNERFVIKFVLLTGSVDESLENIAKRNRDGEQLITKTYLQDLDDLHRSMFPTQISNTVESFQNAMKSHIVLLDVDELLGKLE
jgi:deoxyadenosine/deoxycytidine kinase